MTVLGYDPAELARLHLHLRATVADLRQLARAAGTHPATNDAIATVRRAALDIEAVWLPLVHQVLTTDPLRVRGDGTDLADTAVIRLDVGGVQALGQMLDTVNLDELVGSPAELRVLAAELQMIADDPARRDAFTRHFHEWARLADALATERMFRDGAGDAADVAAIDAVFAGLARMVPADDLAVLEELQPYSAALVVQYLQLDPLALAEVTDQLVLRWCDEPWTEQSVGSPSQYAERSQPNPADVLFPLLLAAGPQATVHYLSLAGAHPQALFAASTDPALTHRLMLTATDPANVDAATAGQLLVPLLEWFRAGYDSPAGTAVHDSDALLFLIDLMAPWTMQLGPLNLDWGLDIDKKAEILAFLVSSDASIDRLLVNLGRIRDRVGAQLHDSESVIEFASYFGFFSRVVLNERVRDEERLAAAWTFTVNLLSVGVSAITLGTTAAVTSNLVIVGLGSLPVADVDEARASAEYADEVAHTAAAAAFAGILHQEWIDHHLVPDDCPPPPRLQRSKHPAVDFYSEYLAWLRHLPGGIDGDLAASVNNVVQTLMNADYVGASSAR